MNKKLIVPIAYVLAAAFVVLGIVYFVTPADHLPHFFPGYSSTITVAHVKHGLACIVLAAGCGAVGWFAGGPKGESAQKEQ
jgi:hypothetical protein